jgi:hypothetical protein
MTAKASKSRSSTDKSNGKLPSLESEILTLGEAAAFLRVSEDGLKADAINSKVPGRLVAGEWRFSRLGLLAWLGQIEITPILAGLTGKDLVEHIRRAGVPWNATSEREAETFIAAMKASSLNR